MDKNQQQLLLEIEKLNKDKQILTKKLEDKRLRLSNVGNIADAALEITKVHDIVKEKYGYETYLFRFPAGTFSEKTLAIAAQNGHHSVFWSFAYNDWDNANQPDATEALKKTTDRLHPGAVYLLHPMETNSKILGDLIANAKAAGYEIGVF